jgi:hypothetical protein
MCAVKGSVGTAISDGDVPLIEATWLVRINRRHIAEGSHQFVRIVRNPKSAGTLAVDLDYHTPASLLSQEFVHALQNQHLESFDINLDDQTLTSDGVLNPRKIRMARELRDDAIDSRGEHHDSLLGSIPDFAHGTPTGMGKMIHAEVDELGSGRCSQRKRDESNAFIVRQEFPIP